MAAVSESPLGRAPEPDPSFLVWVLLFPIVLTAAIALVNRLGHAFGSGENPAFIFAIVGPFAVGWFWLIGVRGRSKAGQEGKGADGR